MSKIIQVISAGLLFLSCIHCEYRYEKPNIAFNAGESAQSYVQSFPAAIYQQSTQQQSPQQDYYSTTVNANGQQYIMELTPSRQIFEGRYLPPATGANGQQARAQTYTSNYYSGVQNSQAAPPQNSPVYTQQQSTAYGAPLAQQNPTNVAQPPLQFSNPVLQQQQQKQIYSYLGNYISQSQASQLAYYQHNQAPAGESRGFQRIIKTCQPNGQCTQLSLAPGQLDPTHEQLVYASRAIITPLTSYEVAMPIPIRPQSRRLFPYSEVKIQAPRDPYN